MKYIKLMLMIIFLCLLAGCASEKEEDALQEASVFAMDTVMSLQAYGDNAEYALNEAKDEIMRLDSLFSRSNEQSEIYKINNERSMKVSDDTATIIKTALNICSSTNGAFDISIAPVMDLWGFYDKNFYVPSDEEITEMLPIIDYNNIETDGDIVSVSGDTQVDLGGIAKGFTSDRIMEIFKENNIKSGLVSLGGNVQTIGTKTDGTMWKVGIQNPDDNSYIGVVSVSDKAVITSGGYQRFFEQDDIKYHHIIDPQTGYPAQSGLKSVTVVSSDGTLADGLSTSLFVMGLDRGTEYWKTHDNFDVIFYTEDNHLYITEGIKDDFESVLEYAVIEK